MPHLRCCVPNCLSSTARRTPVEFIKFPLPPNDMLIAQWKAAIGISQDIPVKRTTRICSRHFQSGKWSLNQYSEDYIPSVFDSIPDLPGTGSHCTTCRNTLMNCLCKIVPLHLQTQYDDVQDDGEDDAEVGRGYKAESEHAVQEGSDERDEDENEKDEEQEVEEPPTPEEVDDGKLMESDDEEWTPTTAVDEHKPRRSGRQPKKRRNVSSDDSEEEMHTPPSSPLKRAKNSMAPPKHINQTPNGSTAPVQALITTLPKTYKVKSSTIKEIKGTTETADATSTTLSTPGAPPATKTAPTPPTKANSNKKNRIQNTIPARARFVTTVAPSPGIQEAKLPEQITDMELEHSRKIETLIRNYNMKDANMKEEHFRKVHQLKIEWELEKANLVSQIEYYKKALHHNGNEEKPIYPFNGGQPIIILPVTDQDD